MSILSSKKRPMNHFSKKNLLGRRNLLIQTRNFINPTKSTKQLNNTMEAMNKINTSQMAILLTKKASTVTSLSTTDIQK
jgi:hypothetical protein